MSIVQLNDIFTIIHTNLMSFIEPVHIGGKNGEAIVYTSDLDNSAANQLRQLVNHTISKNSNIRVMPDVHAGAGCVIGYTAQLNEFIVPNLIGVDIGCGVLCDRIPFVVPAEQRDEFYAFVDKSIKSLIPAGFDCHKKPITKDMMQLHFRTLNLPQDFKQYYSSLQNLSQKVEAEALVQLGTLGGGNHFIEIELENDSGAMWLTVHTGSRNLGKRVADFHQNLATDSLGEKTPKDMWYLTGSKADDYLTDMQIAQVYAKINRRLIRQAIMDVVIEYCKKRSYPKCPKHAVLPETIESVHNFIDLKDRVIRKGAISSYQGQALIIPLNMRDGVILGFGRSNPDWNFSAPHGAGRKCSRSDAKHLQTVEQFKAEMVGVWTNCVSQGTLDEAPLAYKPPEAVLDWLGASVEVVMILKSVYNFKAGASDE